MCGDTHHFAGKIVVRRLRLVVFAWVEYDPVCCEYQPALTFGSIGAVLNILLENAWCLALEMQGE